MYSAEKQQTKQRAVTESAVVLCVLLDTSTATLWSVMETLVLRYQQTCMVVLARWWLCLSRELREECMSSSDSCSTETSSEDPEGEGSKYLTGSGAWKVAVGRIPSGMLESSINRKGQHAWIGQFKVMTWEVEHHCNSCKNVKCLLGSISGGYGFLLSEGQLRKKDTGCLIDYGGGRPIDKGSPSYKIYVIIDWKVNNGLKELMLFYVKDGKGRLHIAKWSWL